MNFKNKFFVQQNLELLRHKKLLVELKHSHPLIFLFFLFCFVCITFMVTPEKPHLHKILPEKVIVANESIYSIPQYNKTNFEIFDTSSISKTLYSSVKILCLISTSRKQLLNRAVHINATWAQRCNKHLFLSYHNHIDLPYLELNVPETRIHFWQKVKALLKWINDHEIDNYDFFLRADDDAYFVMENLRFMLLPYNPDEAFIFGARFKPYSPGGYMSGGAGTVFSRKAVKLFASALNNPGICPEVTEGIDDIEVGACADKLNVTKIDTRDYLGQHRMLPFSPKHHFVERLSKDVTDTFYYPYNQDTEAIAECIIAGLLTPTGCVVGVFSCCSQYVISFHHVYEEMLYVFDYLIYKTKMVGIIDNENIGNLSLNKLKELSKNIAFK